MRRRSLLAILVALMLVLGACGDDDDTTATTEGSTTTTAAGATTTGATTTTTTKPPMTTTTTVPVEDPVWVWITDYTGRVAKISFPNETCEWADVGWSADYVIVAHGFVWVTDCMGEQLVRFSVDTHEENGRLDLGGCASSLWATDRSIWISLPDIELAVEIDPVTGEILAEVSFEGLLTMAAWNPRVLTSKPLIGSIDETFEGPWIGPVPTAEWEEDWGYPKQALRKMDSEGGTEAATILGRTYHHDPDNPSAPAEAWTDIVTHDVGNTMNTWEYRVPGSHHGNYYGDMFNTIEWSRGGFALPEDGYTIWGVDSPTAHTSAGLVGLASMYGKYYHLFDPANLSGGLDIDEWAAGGEPPPLPDQPAVDSYPVGMWCGDLSGYESFLAGPAEYRRQIDLAAAVDAGLFVRDPLAELGPSASGIYINSCSIEFNNGDYAGSSYTISSPVAGIEVHRGLRQGDTWVPTEATSVTDEEGAGAFPNPPDPTAFPEINPDEPYDIVHNLYDDLDPEFGCSLTIQP